MESGEQHGGINFALALRRWSTARPRSGNFVLPARVSLPRSREPQTARPAQTPARTQRPGAQAGRVAMSVTYVCPGCGTPVTVPGGGSVIVTHHLAGHSHKRVA
jgi:hypothetical protein